MRRDSWGMRSLFLVTLLSLVALAGCASGAGAKASVKAHPIMGSRNLYVIYLLIAQTEEQDTLINVPPLQIVQTVSVNVN